MMDWLTLLEIGGGALAVLFVLHVIARVVNRSRAKAAASKLEVPKPEVPKATAAATTNVPSASKEKPMVAPIAVTEKPVATNTRAAPAPPIPAPDYVVPATPPAAPPPPTASKRSSLTRAAAPKAKRRPKPARLVVRKRPAFAPVTKAKPAATRRPKRTAQVRRRKKTAVLPFARGGRGLIQDPIHDQPRLQ
jgi:hypothetical protein